MGDEDLRSLKKAWEVPEADLRPAAGLEDLIAARLRRYRRGVARTLAAEIAAALLIYVLALALLVLSPGRVQSYHVKIMILCALAASGLSAYLIRSLARARADGPAKPAIEHLRLTIDRQTRWIRVYERTAWISAAVIAAVLWADASFRNLSAGWKAGVTLYLAVFAFLVRFALKLLYGWRLAALKKQYHDWTGE